MGMHVTLVKWLNGYFSEISHLITWIEALPVNTLQEIGFIGSTTAKGNYEFMPRLLILNPTYNITAVPMQLIRSSSILFM